MPVFSCHSSIQTAFKDLNLYWIKGALAFVCFSFFLIIFFLATCARLSWILSFWVHVKLFYRIVCGFLWVCAQTKTDRPLLLVEKQLTIEMKNCFSLRGLLIPQQHRSLHKTPPPGIHSRSAAMHWMIWSLSVIQPWVEYVSLERTENWLSE